MTAAGDQGRDFFISYTGADRAWAEWIAVQLEAAGYTTLLQAWDFRPGGDFLHEMQQATTTAARTIAVLSPAYFGSAFGEAEWRAAFAKDPTGERGLLVPVRVQECEPPGLLASRVYIDLVDVAEQEAQHRLLAGVDQSGARPTTAPFPGATKGAKRFPGQGPAVSNLPARNRNFSGRGELLEQLHASLQAESAAAVVPTGAVHGLGGVGKTQLALEFAHRFASDYDVAWWVPAELVTSATAALAALAGRLGVAQVADQQEMVAGLFEELRGRDRWLLVYDNAERPERLSGLLPPGGGGHVLVTSRWSAWAGQATPLRVNVLRRDESIAFLAKRTSSGDQQALAALAELLGDLPLALEEATAYLEETSVGLDEYLKLVRERTRELFGLDQPADSVQADERRVATIWSLSLERVHQQAPAAEALLRLCAFLAPEDIPRELPREHAEVLPDGLAGAVGDVLAYNRLLGSVGRFSLATVTPTSLGVHRLVQAVLQARLGADGERQWSAAAVGLLRASFPNESWEVAAWERCGRLLPHVLAVVGHAERLGVAGEQAGWLLERASRYLRGRGLYPQAWPLAEQALALTEAALGPQDVEVAWRCDELGSVLRELGNLTGARAQYERALAIGEATLGPEHPDVGTWHNDLGLVLQDLGDLAGARVQLERALAISPGVANRHGNLGRVLQALGDLEGARAQLELALVISEATFGPDHPEVAIGHNNLGSVVQELGDLAGARMRFERALAIGEAALGPNHPTVAIWHTNLGRLLQVLGDPAGAKVQLERALVISEATLGPDHPTVARRRNNFGGVLHDLGDLAGARAQYERALAIAEATLGPEHPTVATYRRNLAAARRELGEPAEGF